MEKRKLKFNVLDIAIITVIICAIAVIVFRDVIHDAFGNPEIEPLSVTVAFEEEIEVPEFDSDESISVVLDNGYGETVTANVERAEEGELAFVVNGYKKLGRFYTESGELISLGSECELKSGENVYKCQVKSIDNNG